MTAHQTDRSVEIDALEPRTFRSVSLAKGVLTIDGTKGNDVITVQNSGADQLRVSINGVARKFGRVFVSQINANLGNGHDRYTSGTTVSIPQSVHGGNGNDTVSTGQGDDQLWGDGGADLLDGAQGRNAARYDDAFHSAEINGVGHGVRVTLPNTGDQSDDNGTDGEHDSLRNVDNIVGTPFRDLLHGNVDSNAIHGKGGDDDLFGGDENDSLFGDAGNDLLQGEEGSDEVWGGQGDDQMSGGGGSDTLRYDDDFHIKLGVGVSVKLMGSARYDSFFNGSPGENDAPYFDFENLTGTPFNDTLIGNEVANTIDGLAGNDNILGQRGNDTLIGGSGSDRVFGDDGDDSIFNAVGEFNFTDGGSGTDSAEVFDGDEFFAIETPSILQ